MTVEKCPSREDIVHYLEAGEAGPASRRGLHDHIAACPDCRAVFEAVREIQFQAGTILQGLDGLDLGSAEARRRFRTQARREIRLLRGRGRRRVDRRWFAIPAVGVALALAAAFFVAPALLQKRPGTVERDVAPSEVDLLRPRGTVPGAAVNFQWTVGPEARSRRLEIYDRALEPVYRSAPLTEDRLSLPASALSSLRRGDVYFWKVVVTLKNDQLVESEFAAFALQK
jgi:hypothetical protein